MSDVKHTPGPWQKAHRKGQTVVRGPSSEVIVAVPEPLHEGYGITSDTERKANARLIAAAPDHALVGWAMCVGSGRWEAWGDGRGEFCMNGLRHATKLDAFGIPVVTDAMRRAISKSRGNND